MSIRLTVLIIALTALGDQVFAEEPTCSESVLLAVEMTGELLAPVGVSDQIEQDLAAIRSMYPAMADISASPSWELGVIWVRLDSISRAAYETGTYTALDSINAAYGATEVTSFSITQSLLIDFAECYHPIVLGTIYETLDGVVYAEPNSIGGGTGDDVFCSSLGTYVFVYRLADYTKVYREFHVSDGIVTQVSYSSTPIDGARSVAALSLDQNAPNPFNPSTTIRFTVADPQSLQLRVVDVKGRVVRILRSGFFEDGSYEVEWDGRDSGGERVSSGVYFSVLEGPGETTARKMVVLE